MTRYLIKLGQQKQSLLLIEEEFNAIAKRALEQDFYIFGEKGWAAYPIFYCYVVDKIEAGKALKLLLYYGNREI
jgi:hypothetical protein